MIRIKAYKEGQAWATDERLEVIINAMLFQTAIALRN